MKDNLNMIFFVVILGTMLAGLVIVVNSVTEKLIMKNAALTIKRNVLDAHNLSYKEEGLEESFKREIISVNKSGKTFYVLKNNDVAFEFAGSGLWGPISGVVSLSSDLVTIKRIKIIHQEETPGLGGILAEEKYLKHFEHKKIFPKIEIVNRREAVKKNEVNGITGATMTGKAFEGLLNSEIGQSLELYRSN